MDLSRFLINVDKQEVVLEADDITKEVQDQMDQGSNDTGGSDNNDSSDNTNTDILGAVSDSNDGNDNEVDTTPEDNADSDNTNTDIPTDVEDTGDGEEGSDDMGEGGEDDLGEPSGLDENPIEDSSNEFKFLKKNNLRDSLFMLANISKDAGQYLSSQVTSFHDAPQIEVINKSIKNFNLIHKYTTNILNKDLASEDYATILAKYISLKQIYDVNIDLLEKGLAEHKKEIGKKIKKVNKKTKK